MVALQDITYQEQLIVFWQESQLLPGCQDVVDGIFRCCHREGIAELETVLGKAEHLQLMFTEIAILKPGKLEVGGASRDSTGFGALEEGLISS